MWQLPARTRGGKRLNRSSGGERREGEGRAMGAGGAQVDARTPPPPNE